MPRYVLDGFQGPPRRSMGKWEPELYTVVEAAGIEWVRRRTSDGRGTEWARFDPREKTNHPTWRQLSSLAELGPAYLVGNILDPGPVGDRFHDLLMEVLYDSLV